MDKNKIIDLNKYKKIKEEEIKNLNQFFIQQFKKLDKKNAVKKY